MDNLDDRLRRLFDQRLIALWMPRECDEAIVRAAMPLPWQVIWSEIDPARLVPVLTEDNERLYRVIENKDNAPPAGTSSDITFVYDVSVPTQGNASDIVRKHRRANELENEVEGWDGLLVYAGPADQSADWLKVIEALAPAATVLLDKPNAGCVSPASPLAPLLWTGGLAQLFRGISDYIRERRRHGVVDLKDAPGVEVDAAKVESMGDGWELLTRGHIQPPPTVTQEAFDGFLSGDAAWEAISANAAHPRGSICRLRPRVEGQPEKRHDPVEYVLQSIKRLDQVRIDPSDTVEQILIFAEPGSGCTTVLRQIALAVARAGYPTLITRPYPRRLALESVLNLVVHLQDAWAEARRGPGSGAGTLPVCLVLDVDAELPARFGKLIRGLLGDLHRKVLIVRALRRSEFEIAEARGVLQLPAKTNEPEILALGRHLRTFCEHHQLQPIPGDNEWRAFYESFGRLHAHRVLSVDSAGETPPLFLIGLYPFVKERVRDERSLEQYLYRRWREIADEGGRRLVEILAAAGAHGIAVPFESLMRDQDLDTALFGRLNKNDQRLVDFFCRWLKFGWQKQNWALCIRHPALGVLLTRMLRTAEADIPYAALLPVLRLLVGTEADRWFVEQLVYVLGRRFRSQAVAFSLEIDTAVQRASRAIFKAIPDYLYNSSRTVCHHHARFHIHVLHACLKAMENRNSTHLPEHVLDALAEDALGEATALLERARGITDVREKISNVINTLAAALAQLAQTYARRGRNNEACTYYQNAVERGNEAISHDAANGQALFNVINTVLHRFEANLVDDPREATDLFELAEDRLETLLRLGNFRQWRDADEDETDVAVATLVGRQLDVARKLNVDPRITAFNVRSGVGRVMLKIREVVGMTTLREAFLDSDRARELRDLRRELREIEGKSARGVLLLYKLYLNDSVGRLEFAARLELLGRIERQAPEEYDPYRHDHAALLCLSGSFEAATRLFQQIYSAREADPERWFWINERLLVEVRDGLPRPKRYALRVSDPRMGWARFEDTAIRVKIQPRQFGDLVSGQYISAFIRFRLTGLQAVDARMARFDLEAMGYDAHTGDWAS